MNGAMVGGACIIPLLALTFAACSLGAQPSTDGNDPFAGLSAQPLKLPRLAPGQPCPQAKLSQPYGNSGLGLGSGPVYVLNGELVVSDPEHPQKVSWVADANYSGPIRIRGGRIDGSGQLMLGGPDNHWRGTPVKKLEGTDLYPELDFMESHTTSKPGWRVWPSATYIASPGCYAWQIDGTGFTEFITIQATTYVGSIGQFRCAPGAAVDSGTPERGFDSPKGSLWMIVFAAFPLRAGGEMKIVFRMTGSGDITIRASDADGIESKPTFGPQGHGSSSWDGVHPGAEVGIGFTFSHAGCWNIHLARADTSGDVWLTIG